ncbi:MAG TPA: LuxR C-terminal-related transcriptional regulator [Candidatus Binatia bacterium]|nr:LuxR C-terminal-related transcriptional regulator [Candidatus Binatia bacterium]
MRTSAALVVEQLEPGEHQVQQVLRTLTGLIEAANRMRGLPPAATDSPEEVLVDTEVDGSRYLLLRMRRAHGNRVQLSPREQEIVRMVAKGHPNKVIADVLNISSWTVCTHLRRIFAKLGVGSRAAMVAQLLEMGVLGPEHHVPIAPRGTC